MEEIFAIIDEHIKKDDLITALDMSALPILCVQFIKLIEYMVILSTI